MADDFTIGIKGPNIQESVRGNGDIVRFNATTGEYGVVSNGGIIRTYYKPHLSRKKIRVDMILINIPHRRTISIKLVSSCFMSKRKFLYGHAFGYNSEENFGYNCRICGFKMDNMPWSIDEKYGLDEICPCCGCQSGLNDDSPEFIRENRSNWGVGQNMKWHNPERKPKNWSWQQQRKQIPPAFRDIHISGQK